VNRRFKCEICLEDHKIPEKGLIISELACHLIASKPKPIWRGKKYEKLKTNLDKLDSLKRRLKFDLESGNDNVKIYCNEQKRRVQLAFEKMMQVLNDLNEAFIKQIDDYEMDCIKQSKIMNETAKANLENLINEANNFVSEQKEFLNKLEIDDDEIESFNIISEDLHLKLDQELKNCKSLSFGSKLLKYNPNSTETLIGSIDYERINPTVYIFKLN